LMRLHFPTYPLFLMLTKQNLDATNTDSCSRTYGTLNKDEV
jgi:hypothetical protein